MKRNDLLCALSLSLLLFSGCAKQTEQMSYIGAEAAKQLALDSAGLTASSVESITTDMSTRDGLDYYQVDFTVDGQEYQYDIDALTGTVIDTHSPAGAAVEAPDTDANGADHSTQADPEVQQPVSNPEAGSSNSGTVSGSNSGSSNAAVNSGSGKASGGNSTTAAGGNSGGSNTAANSGSGKASGGNSNTAAGSNSNRTSSGSSNAAAGTITADEAKSKALSHAGLTSDQVTFVKSKLDYENGRQVYEVEFYTQDYTEYDYEIDASTGEVISYDYDAEYYTAPASSGSSTITADEAKEIALAQVPGAAAGDIQKFKTDYDDGRTEYEGTILYNGMEYEFEIDGYSGAIRSWEAEPAGR